MANWFTKNLWLKLISLALAVIAWFYVHVELSRSPGEEKTLFWIGYGAGNKIKQVRILSSVTGQPAEGYIMRSDKITLKPNTASIIGPRRLVDKIEAIKTVQIDITGQTKTYKATIPLESAEVEGVRFYGAVGATDIIIPIEKAQ